MSKKISFIIASKRPYEQYAKNFVDNLCNSNHSKNFEIVICHPNIIDDNRIIYVEDDKRIGSSYAYNKAFEHSTGDYISVCIDDGILLGDIFSVIDFLESDLFSNRKFKITTLAGGLTDELTRPEPQPTYPEYLIKTNNYTTFPTNCNVACFPIVKRETIEKYLGSLWHPRIKIAHDWWLGSFLALNDEPIIQYNAAKFEISSNSSEFIIDPILKVASPRFFGESYVNTYRLIKNYKIGMNYVYDTEEDYLSEDKILSY